jgi:hypothetical protein
VAKAELEEAKERAAAAEKKLADAKARPEIRGQSAMQMVIAISLITRACPDASFQEIHDMWAAHAGEDSAEQKRKDAANAGGGAALAAYLGSWLSAGSPMDKCLCACLEPGCPTFDKVYVRGRGFVDRVLYAEEQREAEAEEEREAYEAAVADLQATCAAANAEILERAAASVRAKPAAPPAAPPPKKTWAQIAAAKRK